MQIVAQIRIMGRTFLQNRSPKLNIVVHRLLQLLNLSLFRGRLGVALKDRQLGGKVIPTSFNIEVWS